MSERQKARLSMSDSSDEDEEKLLSKRGFNILFAIILGNIIGGTLNVSGALSGIATRVLIIVAILLVLDRMVGVSRQWIPPMLKQQLRKS